MPSSTRNTKKILLFLFASIFFLFASILAGRILKQNFDSDKAASKLQTEIFLKDQQIKIDLLNFIDNFSKTNSSSFFSQNSFFSSSQDKGFFFFVLENDTLLFWSTNQIPYSFLTKKFLEPLIFAGNGYFRAIEKTVNDKRFIALYLIKHSYAYQNEYLENSFHPSFNINLPAKISLSPEKDGISIFSENGSFLFSVLFTRDFHLKDNEAILIFFLYLLSLCFFIGFIHQLYLLVFRRISGKTLIISALLADILLIRLILFYFDIPSILYDSSLFNPSFYAYSEIIPSLGDLFLHVFFVFTCAIVIFHHFKLRLNLLRKKIIFRIILSVFALMLIPFLFSGVLFIIESLVNDSVISLNLNNIFSLSLISLFSFTIIIMAFLAFLLLTSRIAFVVYRLSGSFNYFFLLSFLSISIFFAYQFFFSSIDWIIISFSFLYILSFGLFFRYQKFNFTLFSVTFYISLFAFITTHTLHINNQKKELEHRKLLAIYLASEQRDPIAEYLFDKKSAIIKSDTSIITLSKLANLNPSYLDSLDAYLSKTYFSDYFSKFDQQITVCNKEDLLIVKPNDIETGCWEFFETMVKSTGYPTQNENLLFLKTGPDDNRYLAFFDYSPDSLSETPFRIFIEFYPKYVARDLGFPDLLIDRKVTRSPDLSDYSYAKYLNGNLQHRVGKFFYSFSLDPTWKNEEQISLFDQNGYSHLIYKIDSSRDLVISIANKTFLDILAPFSYLFLFFAFFCFITFLLLVFSNYKKHLNITFRNRLQISMSAVILFSFLVIGFFTLFYIRSLNSQKNNDILSEKTHSILVELQHKFSDISSLDQVSFSYISELLIKFSNVFFSDINLFDVNGELIASSRRQIFDENLISRLMNPIAFIELTQNGSSLFIQTEKIGKQTYLSSYIPFVNPNGKVIAYLNLPYFAKENDLRREISNFLVAYVNIYVIFIAVTILLALIISNYVSRPIKLIMSKIRKVNLGAPNEKIDWNHDDEIGQLVKSYNSMIDELAISAELLAKSERETAWREMARQVAHEIKNPLTPMKLSVQHLQHAWNQHAPDWNNRLERFTRTMIEQIDTLSVIASEFSDFAKMPATNKIPVNVSEVIYTAIALFRNYDSITFSFIQPENENFIILADKDQLLRAFNNLIKNSIQAIGNKNDGCIKIEINRVDKQCIINISDNGSGINPELTDKIFLPYFTTKTSGMGLGLAIVKNIIISSQGEIHFDSQAGKGTRFTIIFPLLTNE